MSEFDPSKTTTTNIGSSADYLVPAKALDIADGQEEYYWYFSNASKNFGYYKQIPELKKAIDALAMWTCGRGYTVEIDLIGNSVDNLSGWGEDCLLSLLWNMIVVKKVNGDSFAETIRNQNNTIINLKPLSPERVRIVLGANGLIKRYDYLDVNKNWTPIKTMNMLHLCNDRVGNECHGTSVIDACKWVIDARNEAMDVYRKILKRSLAYGILEVDTGDAVQIAAITSEYKDAVKNGEVLVLPKGLAEIKDTKISVQDFLSWIRYLEDFFYQAVGIPKIILGGSDQVSEGSNKMSSYNFEQVYMSEQKLLEDDLWNQLMIKIKFERPNSLQGNMQANEAKNTSQTSFQPKDFAITGGRE